LSLDENVLSLIFPLTDAMTHATCFVLCLPVHEGDFSYFKHVTISDFSGTHVVVEIGKNLRSVFALWKAKLRILNFLFLN
jgi:hypothetical protein